MENKWWIKYISGWYICEEDKDGVPMYAVVTTEGHIFEYFPLTEQGMKDAEAYCRRF